ncbi:calcium/sodium antiporter [Candidatus Poribacteria bacterium]|nr:calcium/sodium antiporter [Candidatus Poribacteria bacterium]
MASVLSLLDASSFLHAAILLAIGVVLLEYGANWLVGGASSLARRLGISPVIVGSTIVSAGTTLPELMVSLFTILGGTTTNASDIAIGNVVGSNIVDIGLIIGLAALIASMAALSLKVLLPELWIMLGTMVLLGVLTIDGRLNFPLDPLILFLVFLGYIGFQVWEAKAHPEHVEEMDDPHGPLHVPLLIVGGIVCLAFGARSLVNGAVFCAQQWGVPELVIGLTIVAIGTSLPELATNVTAALKGESSLGVGDVVGANILNIAFNLGIVGLLAGAAREITVASEFFARDYWWMLGFGVLLTAFLWAGKRVPRWGGAVMGILYIVYAITLFV